MTPKPEGAGRFGFFQDMHAAGEPFNYSARAIESLRHDRVLQIVQSLAPRNVLEIGCSLGLLTQRLTGLFVDVTAVDLSPIAVARARARLDSRPHLFAANILSFPVKPGSFDLVLASDGPMSWYLTAEERIAAYKTMRNLLRRGGHLVVTEYLRPRRFEEFVTEIEAGGLQVESVSYLYNRPWYKLERLFRRLPGGGKLIASRTLARAVCGVSRVAGRAAAHHIMVTATGP